LVVPSLRFVLHPYHCPRHGIIKYLYTHMENTRV
jgi:hypothetical protein